MESTEEPAWAERFWAKTRKNETTGCIEWTASKRPNGYGQFGLDGKVPSAHRVAWELAHGPIPKGLDVDHLCHNRACVNAAHLRLATRKQNLENQNRPPRSNTSGFRGVSFHRKYRKWQAYVTHNGRWIYCGMYATPEAAAAAAAAKRAELFTPIPEIPRAAC